MLASSDEDLVRQAASGSAPAREELFRRHYAAVWGRAYAITGRRESADDITQDAFVKGFQRLDRVEHGAAFAGWMTRIAVNRAIDLLRAERRVVPLGDAAEIGVWDAEPGGDRQLQAAVSRLTPERRAVLVMRYWLDLPPTEIADVLGIALGTVHSRLARALADLRAELDGRRP